MFFQFKIYKKNKRKKWKFISKTVILVVVHVKLLFIKGRETIGYI